MALLALIAALVVAGLVATGLVGALGLAAGRRRRPAAVGPAGRPAAVLSVAGIGVVGIVVVLLGVGGLLGARRGQGGRDGGDGGAATTTGPTTTTGPVPATTGPLALTTGPTTTAPAATGPTTTAPAATASSPARAPGGAALGPVVQLRAEDDDEAERFPPSAPEAVGGLAPGTVLQVQVSGFPWFAAAQARQCVTTTGRGCGNAVPVQFDGAGKASFQYLVGDDFVAGARTGRCRAGAAPCFLVVSELDGDARAERQTVFHDALPAPGRIRVTPSRGLVDGQTIVVEVAGYPPGAAVDAMLCAPPDATGARRCGAPGPRAPMAVGADGTGRTELVVRAGPVGTERRPCRHGEVCGVSVAAADVFARAPVAPIRFATPPGAAYDPARLATGLALAVLLLAAAALLVLRTEWAPPGEAAAPEIDDATYADLDAIVAALPPERDAGLDAAPH